MLSFRLVARPTHRLALSTMDPPSTISNDTGSYTCQTSFLGALKLVLVVRCDNAPWPQMLDHVVALSGLPETSPDLFIVPPTGLAARHGISLDVAFEEFCIIFVQIMTQPSTRPRELNRTVIRWEYPRKKLFDPDACLKRQLRQAFPRLP